jgi:hypothetical protein
MAHGRPIVASILAALMSLLTSPTMGQDRPAPRSVVIFIDDFYIQFQNTPTLRRGVLQAVARLLAAGRLVGMASDGPSSISVPLTSDSGRLLAVANRLSGSGLRADVTADPTPAITADLKRRETIADETLQSLLRYTGIDAILYVTERQIQPISAAIPIVITRPKGMEAAVAEFLSMN